MNRSGHRRSLLTASWLGVCHACVDAASVGVVFGEWSGDRLSWDAFRGLIILYNGLAFGLQVPLGWLADRIRVYRGCGLGGLLLIVAGVLLCRWQIWLAVVLAALGNALFHVGAGAIVLHGSLRRATEAGLFLAPGALGLSVGIWLGRTGWPDRQRTTR